MQNGRANGHASDRKEASASGQIKVASLFSGAGGMDLGFRGGFTLLEKEYARLPFDIVWANDLNPAACKTYEKNLGANTIHCGDVLKLIEKIPAKIDAIVGGFPCQDVSINGKRSGLAGKRTSLYGVMVKAIAETRPRVFVAENVKGLLSLKDAMTKIIGDFSALGYSLSYHLYLAADYGVPQMRQRVFIVGTAPGVKPFRPPWPTHQRGDWITAQKAVGDLESMEENEAINHVWSRAEVSGEQGNRKLKADQPSATIRAECHGNIQWHYKLPRRISMREAARFQSFPDDFVFASKLRETERQVGNAVPPVLAWHVAKAVAESMQ